MKIKYLDLNHIHTPSVKKKILKKITNIIDTNSFILGKHVEEFEKKFAKYCGTKYCVAVNSGTSALLLSLMSLNLPKKSNIVVPAISFVATAEVIKLLGHNVIFCDVDCDTYNLNTIHLADILDSERVACVIPVHLHGQLCDIKEVVKLCKRRKITVIEDACQAHGASLNNKKAGSFGNMGCFSFYPSKNLGAFGDAGAITTNNKKSYEKLRILRNHGATKKYYHDTLGINARMSNIQGAVLCTKLSDLEKQREKRVKIAKKYNDRLKDTVITPLFFKKKHVYHVYAIGCESKRERDELQSFLKEKEIDTLIHYPVPLLEHKIFEKDFKYHDIVEAYVSCDTMLSLPLYVGLTNKEIDYVCSSIKEYYNV